MKPAARELGVSYEHLLLCIKGNRVSRSLMERYRALKADRANVAKTIKHSKNGTKP